MTDELKQWEYDKGYEKGKKDGAIEELEKIKAEIEDIEELDYNFEGFYHCQNEALKIIDKHITELKGEQE